MLLESLENCQKYLNIPGNYTKISLLFGPGCVCFDSESQFADALDEKKHIKNPTELRSG